MEDRTLTITTDSGEEILCEILFTTHSEEFNKDYVVFVEKGTNTASAIITAANWRRRAPPVSITSPASPPNIIKASCRRRQDAHRCFCSAPPEQGRNIWRAQSTCAARVAATLLFRSTVTY